MGACKLLGVEVKAVDCKLLGVDEVVCKLREVEVRDREVDCKLRGVEVDGEYCKLLEMDRLDCRLVVVGIKFKFPSV